MAPVKTENVTGARPSKKDRAIVQVDAPETTPAAAEPAPVASGTAIELPVSDKLDQSPAAQNAAAEKGNDQPIEVPATPTPATLAAGELLGEINTAILKFQKLIPSSTTIAPWVDPDDDAVEAMVEQYVKDNPGTKMRHAYATVEASIAARKSEYDKLVKDSAPTTREWLHAAIAAMRIATGGLEELFAQAGGKLPKSGKSNTSATEKAVKEPRATGEKPLSTWKDRAPKLLTWAKETGLHGFYFVDLTDGGYKGKYHVVKLHEDGRFEKCNFSGEGVPTPTGEYVSSPIYFNTDGEDRATHGGDAPKYSLSNDVMFGVYMLAADGKSFVQIDGININNKKGVKRLATNTAVFADAGCPFGK